MTRRRPTTLDPMKAPSTMNAVGMPPRSRKAPVGGRHLVGVVALAAGLTAASSLAQTGYGGADPAVEVDLSVLESLGRAPAPPAPLPGAQAPYRAPVAAPAAATAGAAPRIGPRPPPGREGLKRMQRSINAWAWRQSGDGPRVAPAPAPAPAHAPAHATAGTPAPAPGPVVPPPARVVPAPVATAEPLLIPPPRPTTPEKPGQPTRLVPAPPAAPSPLEPATAVLRVPPPVAAPTPPPRTAAQPPAAPPGTLLRVGFDPESADLAASAESGLDAIAERLVSEAGLRIQLRAFAEGDKEDTSQVRRLSLYRALAVRSYLIKKGVRGTRMDVRALGDGYKEGPGNRVDVVLVER